MNMLAFMGVGPQELIIVAGICCMLLLPAIAAVVLIAVLANAKRKE